MAELDFEELKEKSHAAAQLKLQAIFYSVTALSSAAYVSYVLVYTDLVEGALGTANKNWALLILAGSLLLEAFLEIPTGALADRYGHHRSVLWSFVALSIHAVFYLIAILFRAGPEESIKWTALIFIILSECLLALGTAFQTGSLHGWFITSMKHEGYRGLYHVFMGRRRLTTNVIWLVTGIFILLLKNQEPYRFTLAFTVSLVAYIIAAVVTYRLVTAKAPKAGQRVSISLAELFSLMRDEFYGAVREILKNRKLILVVASHAIFWTLGVTLVYFWKEILRISVTSSNNEFAIGYAITWLMLSFARILGSELSGRIKIASVGERDTRVIYFVVGQLLIGVPLLFIFTYGGVSLSVISLGAVLLALSRIGQELSKPITMAWTHEEVKNDRFRATVDSLIESATGFVIVIIVVPLMIIANKQNMADNNASRDILMKVIVFLSVLTIFFNATFAWVVMRSAKFPRHN